jgi:hypothetical protein
MSYNLGYNEEFMNIIKDDLGYNEEFMNIIKDAYNNTLYISNLNEIKKRMRKIYANCIPQFDDIEAEILCLILMYLKPSLIYEFSPCGGWSTSYMLNTIDIMKIDCNINSFDIIDNCTHNINDELKDRWHFHLGNVENEYDKFTDKIDFLFIDSDHSAEFTKKYITNVLEPLLISCKNNNKKIFVSVHDVFHTPIPSDEGKLVIEFLEKNNIKYFSPNNNIHKNDINSLRNNNNLDTDIIHFAPNNPVIFFILG